MSVHRFLAAPLAGGLLAVMAAASAMAQPAAGIDIPYKRFVLKNGLTLIVHEDRKAPIVAVNVWYHVGSKNEQPGRTGFAHLFEHLMFNGSEHFDDDYFKVLDRLGATDLNGTTNEDRTNYFQNVPTRALDTALWMESDRMGHLLGAITQAKLDEQRGVVQNEKRQGENEPYGKVDLAIAEATYPKGHPYSWTVIGSMEDLAAASLDDVKKWFTSYYGPSNAVLVIAGDIDAETARQKVERYFGDIPPGPPVTKHQAWIAKRTGEQRQVMEDRVPMARIYMVWNVPQWGSADADLLGLAANVLATGKTSRLYKRLVYDDQIATDVSASLDSREIASQFYVMATVRPGIAPAKVEQALREELAALLKDGPTPAELERVKTQRRAAFVRGVERIGGFGGKSDVLAQGEVYAGNPEQHAITQRRIAEATPAAVRDASSRWLSDGVYVLEVRPFPQYATTPSTVDRSAVPTPGAPPAVRFPAFERATLANGLKLVVAPRQSVPQVNLTLLVDSGFAADQSALPGTASLALDMMDEGTASRSALQIAEDVAGLGATLSLGATLDTAAVRMSALKENLDASLAIFGDVVLNPSFPADELERLRRRRLAQIQQEGAQPIGIALRVLPGLIYGPGHAYGLPLTGSGTIESVGRITRDTLLKFHGDYFKPSNATLIVVGATTMAEIKPRIEKLFAAWKPGPVPARNVRTVAAAKAQAVYVIDRPGAEQSLILAGHVAPPKSNPDEIAIEAMNAVLGGQFVSRINMNIREDKHWSYGAQTLFWDARGQRPFIVYAPVQTDKTKEAIQEIQKELRGILGQIPVSAEELAAAKNALVLTLPGQWETMSAVGATLQQLVTFGLPDDYFDTYGAKVGALGAADLVRAAKVSVHPDSVVWVVVGDLKKIEAPLKALGLGDIRLLDADGKVKPGS
ncbi:MAG TPA: pitrilysin family protein [Vicinamibacterales bacterium]|nr:pitrilysin family protein [Vicinamibacterales bacterium]HPW19366.1 pitrilysin family protein [Vicinamibacterales bacterium]